MRPPCFGELRFEPNSSSEVEPYSGGRRLHLLLLDTVGEQYPAVVVLVLASFSLDTLLALILGVSLFSVGVDERKPRRRAVSADRRGEEVELRVTVHSESLRAEIEPTRFLRG